MAENTPLTIKERMVLKKLDTIIILLTEIYGKICGENPYPTEIKHYDIDGDEIPF
jgi:hypothetical protein